MTSPLGRFLGRYAVLSNDEQRALARIGRHCVRAIAPRRDLVREGADAGRVRLILEGWACRYKCLSDGRRQTLGFLIPGDLCDPGIYLLKRMDHGIGAITAVRYAEISRAQMELLAARSARLSGAIAWSALVAVAIEREWILSIGRRSAREQIAHLVAELFHRLSAIGAAGDGRCDFPLTQNDLADATGLTPVHVNRVLKGLRRDGLMRIEHRTLVIPDLDALERAGLFDGGYLHLGERCEAGEAVIPAMAAAKALKSQPILAL